MMTRAWRKIVREVLCEDPRRDRGIGHRDDTLPPIVGAASHMMDMQPALWEADFEDEDETAGLWNYLA